MIKRYRKLRILYYYFTTVHLNLTLFHKSVRHNLPTTVSTPITDDSRLRRRVRNWAAPSGGSRLIIRYVANSKPTSMFPIMWKNVVHKPEVHKVLHIVVKDHGHRQQEQKISWSLDTLFLRYASAETDKQIHKQTYRHEVRNTSHSPLAWRSNRCPDFTVFVSK